MTDKKLRRLLHEKFSHKQDAQDLTIGILGTFVGVVTVPGRPDYVYVRIADQVHEIYGRGIPRLANTQVFIGKNHNELDRIQVIGVRSVASESSSNTSVPVPLHAEQHRYLGSGPGGGRDTLWSEGRQLLPLRIGAGGGLTVNVYRSIVYTGDTALSVPTTTVDLTALVPAVVGKAAWALIWMDADGVVLATTGAEIDYDTLTITDVPAAPDLAVYVLGAVRLYQGQTVISDDTRVNGTDILDFRYPMWRKDAGVGAGDVEFVADGMLAVASEVGGWYISPRGQEISNVRVYLDDTGNGTSTSTTIDVKMNGTTVLLAPVSITANNNAAGYASVTPDKPDVVTNGILTVDITGVATKARGLCVIVSFSPSASDGSKAIHQGIFTAVDNIFVGAGTLRLYNSLGSIKTISKVLAAVDTPPGGSAIIVDIKNNGTSIFTETSHRPTIAIGANVGVSTNIDNPTWAVDTYLTMDIVQVGSTVSGANLTVHIVFS
jgi:hypothetical protein